MKMGLNGSAMSPHGLIFNEDEATGCPMPLETLPTPFGGVFEQFSTISPQQGRKSDFSSFAIYPLLGLVQKLGLMCLKMLIGVLRWGLGDHLPGRLTPNRARLIG